MSERGVSIAIKPSGIEAFQRRLQKLNINMSRLEEPMREAGGNVRTLAASYPPYGDWHSGKPSFTKVYPGAKYVRTRTLQKAWKGQLRKGSRVLFTYRVYNYTTFEHNTKRRKFYLRYVQGEDQVSPHVGRWYNIDDIKRMGTDEMNRVFTDFMHRVTRS